MEQLSRRPSTTSDWAAGRITVVSAERAIWGLFTPKASSSFLESGSRKVMASTYLLITLAALTRLLLLRMGPIPQPYMITGQPLRLAQAKVQR